MPKVTARTTDKKATIPGLPSYLVVGTASRGRSSRTKVGLEHLTKMFEWWNSAQPTLKAHSARDVGLPALKLAEECGLHRPRNGNSFRAKLQRQFDGMNIEGRTMYLSLRGAQGAKFRITPRTMVWFHPVPVSERIPSRRTK
jgi:hypothetical protein